MHAEPSERERQEVRSPGGREKIYTDGITWQPEEAKVNQLLCTTHRLGFWTMLM